MNMPKETRASWLMGLGCALLVLGTASMGFSKGTPVVIPTLTEAQQATLIFMHEEEKVARDVYLHLYELWGDVIFSNIAQSEQQHMDALSRLMVKYGVADPASGLPVGVFQNSDLQALYDALILQGEASRSDACEVGVLIEETDIADLDAAIQGSTTQDTITVYGNLRAGSYKHLSAFTAYLAVLESVL